MKPSPLLRYVLVVLCLFLLFTCKQEYSYEGGNQTSLPVNPVIADTASFILEGSPGDCIIAVPAGSFVAGNSNSSNTITISVNVQKTGDYHISTDTLDNIYFSASGHFSNTGVQNVTLYGHGTPDKALNLIFTPSSSYSHCTIHLSVLPPGSQATYVIESNYGSPNPCTYQLNGNYVKGISLSSSNTVDVRVTAVSIGSFAIATQTVNGISFYYSGTFTTTGTQYVTLQGSGTPISSGIFSFSPAIVGPAPLGGHTCALNVTVQ